jgi:hypothetical protein
LTVYHLLLLLPYPRWPRSSGQVLSLQPARQEQEIIDNPDDYSDSNEYLCSQWRGGKLGRHRLEEQQVYSQETNNRWAIGQKAEEMTVLLCLPPPFYCQPDTK